MLDLYSAAVPASQTPGGLAGKIPHNVRGDTELMSNHRGVMLAETYRLNAIGDAGLLL